MSSKNIRSVSITGALHARLKTYAETRGLTQAAVVEHAVEADLTAWERKQQRKGSVK